MLLVNCDGADATGKTTLIENLVQHYTNQNKKITYLHFPRYETEIGKIVRKVLLKKDNQMHPAAFQMLCSADRVNWSVYEYPILKEEYDIILVDRHSSSGIIYGQIDGLDIKEVLCNDKHIIQPDLHLILIADVETSMNRMANRDEENTKYENAEGIRNATELFLELDEFLPNVHYIDANGTIEEVLEESINIIESKLEV
jgi:dTMP kinase